LNNPTTEPLFPKRAGYIFTIIKGWQWVQACVKVSPTAAAYTALCKTAKEADELADVLIETITKGKQK
jgi:hypothetical protein